MEIIGRKVLKRDMAQESEKKKREGKVQRIYGKRENDRGNKREGERRRRSLKKEME